MIYEILSLMFDFIIMGNFFMYVKQKTISALLAATFVASMAWGTASADVSRTVDAKMESSVKASHQAKAPTYTGKTLQSTRSGIVQGYVQDQTLI